MNRVNDSTGVFSMGSVRYFRGLQGLFVVSSLALLACSPSGDAPADEQTSAASKPALTVELVEVQQAG